MAQLHFVTGKGGVGKSSLAAALALSLSRRGEGPVLLLEVQGSGRSLELLGATTKSFENTPLPEAAGTWGARVLPREAFKQYFNLLLALGKEASALAQATSEIRRRLVDLVLENRVVSAFVDVCPGLEPSVLLGKIHWEATQGRTPDGERSWRHVVVDAPATGHGLMLFRSTNALTEVFGTGPIFKQAAQIMSFIRDPQKTRLLIATTLEELPLQESLDMHRELQRMGIDTQAFLLNRSTLGMPSPSASSLPLKDAAWQRETQQEIENNADQVELLAHFEKNLGEGKKKIFFGEIFAAERSSFVNALADAFGEDA